ncbi:terminase [Staphylococcus sp. 11007852]|uniref:phage tail protein n=1 Tax=Staphylococcus sp. 11007852 TaxID=2714543 RepID=UPI001402EF0B|nr:terminase [Staphylococcus sp. 11007852]NHM75416.1 terminase [Staphylococcus sp. 11007852]
MESNFMVKIMAVMRDFESNIRKAQRMAKTAVPNEIETDVKANISRFQRDLQRAKAMAQKGIGNIRSKIAVESEEFKRKVAEAKAYLNTMKRHKVDLKLSDEELMTKYGKDKATIEAWRKHVVELDLDTSPALMAAKGFEKSMIDINKHVFHQGRWRMQLDDGSIGKFVKTIDRIGPTARNNFDKLRVYGIKAFQSIGPIMDDFNNKVDAFASRIRSFATVFSQTFKGLMVASVQALIPIIASLVPALMAVLNAVGVLGGGVLGLAGAFSVAGAGAVVFGAMAISAIKMLKDGTLQATKETRAYQSALNGVKSTWQSIIKQNQAQIFNTLANGLNTVKTALTALKPFIAGVSQSMEQASQKVLKWAQNSQTASKFFSMMNTTGVKTFNALLSAAGRFGDGLVNVFTQLAPLFLWVAQGLDSLGQKFQNWANSVGGQNAIRSFIEYTKTNLPKIGQIFGNVFLGIGNLMRAFAQNSSGIFDALVQMTSKFRQWSETVGNSEGFKKFVEYVQQNGPIIMDLIGNIVRALVAFGTAMAPIASVVLRVITALTGFIANLFETHPAIAKLVGIAVMLAGALWSLSMPIMLVQSILRYFGLSFLGVIGNIARFISTSGVLSGALNLLRGAFTFLMSPIANIGRLLPLLGTAFTALTGPIGIAIAIIGALVGVIVYLWKTNEDFRNMIINAWNGIVSAISGAVSSIVSWFQQLWASIQQTLQPIMPILQQLGQIFMQILGVVIMTIIQNLITTFQLLWTVISVVFTAIGGIISSVVQIIVGLFTAFIQLLTGDFSGAWLTLQNTISNVMNTVWSTLVSIWNQISNFIFSILNRILGTNITTWGQIWSAITGFVTRIWNSVSTWFTKVAVTVLTKMVQAYNYIMSNGARWVSSIWNTMVSFVAKIVSGFLDVVSEIGNGMSRGLDKIKSFFGDFISAGVDLISSVAEGIASAAWKVVSAVGNAIADAWGNVTSFISGHGGGAISQAQMLASSVGDAFSTELSSTLTDGMTGMGGVMDAHMTKDVQHSMQENNRPIVNIVVKNESDLPAIKSYIEETNAKNASFALM